MGRDETSEPAEGVPSTLHQVVEAIIRFLNSRDEILLQRCDRRIDLGFLPGIVANLTVLHLCWLEKVDVFLLKHFLGFMRTTHVVARNFGVIAVISSDLHFLIANLEYPLG